MGVARYALALREGLLPPVRRPIATRQSSFLTPFIGMPRNKKTVISDGIPYLVEKLRHRCIILSYHP